MCKDYVRPTWQEELTEILEDDQMTGTITIHCQDGKVKNFEVMRRYKAAKGEDK